MLGAASCAATGRKNVNRQYVFRGLPDVLCLYSSCIRLPAEVPAEAVGPARTGGAGEKARPAGGAVQVIPLSRANNISIMLTQFAGFKRGPQDIRRALITGSKALGTERLSLLLQAGSLKLSDSANVMTC